MGLNVSISWLYLGDLFLSSHRGDVTHLQLFTLVPNDAEPIFLGLSNTERASDEESTVVVYRQLNEMAG